MDDLLGAEQAAARRRFREVFATAVAPHASEYDRTEAIPRAHIERLAGAGYLGAAVPERYGGRAMDPLTVGILHEELGRASASMQGIANVHGMVEAAVLRCGSQAMRDEWLPPFARGERLGAVAISEPGVGSDARSVTTTARADGGHWVLSGRKAWITAGQIADVLLVLAQAPAGPTAFLVERSSPGVTVTPMPAVVGCRGYMLAEIAFEGCHVPARRLVGREGWGLSHVMGSALEAGRLALAWCCVGIGQACVDASRRHARERIQFGVPIREHQLVQRLLARMTVGVRAARLVCWSATRLRASGSPDAGVESCMAKYFASTTLRAVTRDAVRLHGAQGCSAALPLERHLRDATIMEVIEGTTEIHETVIGRYDWGTGDDLAEECA